MWAILHLDNKLNFILNIFKFCASISKQLSNNEIHKILQGESSSNLDDDDVDVADPTWSGFDAESKDLKSEPSEDITLNASTLDDQGKAKDEENKDIRPKGKRKSNFEKRKKVAINQSLQGLEHVNSTGKVKLGKVPKPANCTNCKLTCNDNVSEEECAIICRKYWNSSDYYRTKISF